MWLNNHGQSSGLLPGRESLGPLFLMATTPIFIFILWFTMYELEGDFAALIGKFKSVRRLGLCLRQPRERWEQIRYQEQEQNVFFGRQPHTTNTTTQPHLQNGWSYLGEIVPTPFDPTAWKVILSYMAVELAFMR